MSCLNVHARIDSEEVVEKVDGLEQMLVNVFMKTFVRAKGDVPASIHIDPNSDCLPNRFQNL